MSIVSLQSLKVANEGQREPEPQQGGTPCWTARGRGVSLVTWALLTFSDPPFSFPGAGRHVHRQL